MFSPILPVLPWFSVDTDEVSMQDNTSGGEIQFSQPKKAKLPENLKKSDKVSNVSPVLQHKIPARSSNDDEIDDDSDDTDEDREQTNLFGVNFLMWFEVGIEEKILWIKMKKTGEEKLSLGFTRKLFPLIRRTISYFLRTSAPRYTLVLVGSWGYNPMSENG